MMRQGRGLAWVGPLSLLALCLLQAAPGHAADGLVVDEGPVFAVVRAAGALAEGACAPGEIGQNSLRESVLRVQRELGLDAELAVVLASAPPSCGNLFYVPVANDVSGIGYGHERSDELFDDSADSALEGIAFLNDWPYWETRPEELGRAFKHELGHRWGARVRASIDGEASSELLGRQLMHWSFFLDSAASPLEGNAWHSSDERSFRSQTELSSAAFSQLDLYLMGVAEAAEVEPSLLLRHVDAEGLANARDCRAAPLSAASPPAHCESLTLEAEPSLIAIEDIIAVEGERVPVAETQRTLDVLVIVLESERQPLSLESCQALDQALIGNLDDFARATRGRIVLNNLTGFRTSCGSVSVAPTLNGQRGCSLAAVGAAAHETTHWPALLVLAWLCSRRARRRKAERAEP
ncbi:MAG: hypothetical protein ABW217_19975 [Polyangiaceae bacterium]